LKEIWPRAGFSGHTGGEGAGKTQPHSAYKTRELIRESEDLSMHVIPQSWSHLHILISVFPPIGLLLVLGLYIAGLKRDNDFTRQTCLLLFAGLGLLSIPILVSGLLSMSALTGNTRFAPAAINTHLGWSIAALVALLLTGVAAGLELWRARRAHRPSGDPFHAILGLAGVTLILTGIASELGIEINHTELQLSVTIPDISTPQAWSHAHLILNHIPTAGFVFALVFFITALITDNDVMKRGSLILFVICSIIGVPTYVAGTAAMWAITQPPIPGNEISLAVINSHRDMALWTLFGLAFTGGAAWIELWRSRSIGHFSKRSLNLVLVFAVITLGIMTETGHRGGLINHPEIRLAGDVLPTDPDVGISTGIEAVMKQMIWFVPWQTVHFFGYCLIFGAVFAVVLRVLGFWKSVSFAATHRLLVLGFLGVIMNVVSGMLMMFGDSYRYVVSDTTFAPKVALIPLGAMAVLYFSASDRLWNVKAGENAPRTAKWVAAGALLAWAGVLICGRMLPYL